MSEGREPDFPDILARLDPCDVIIVEGYKSQPIPKIETRRKDAEPGFALAGTDPNVFAVASDGETVLIVHSPRLASAVADAIESSMSPGNSWSVSAGPDGAIRWVGSDATYDHEPETGFWLRFKAGLFGLLPIEKYL